MGHVAPHPEAVDVRSDRRRTTGRSGRRHRPRRRVAGDRRPRVGLRLSHQQRLAESIRILFGTIAFFAFLIALPILALVPFFMVALFLGVFGTLFSGIV